MPSKGWRCVCAVVVFACNQAEPSRNRVPYERVTSTVVITPMSHSEMPNGTSQRLEELLVDAKRPDWEHYGQPKVISYVAWCAKANLTVVPPDVFHEVIVIVQWSAAEKWSLVYAFIYPDGSCRLNDAIAYARCRMWDTSDYDSLPTEEDIAPFLEGTNFGNNENSEMLKILSIVIYQEGDPTLKRLFDDGLPELERRRRNGCLERQMPIRPQQ